MNNTELIDELTDICIRQAEIIREQAYVLEQLGEETMEDPELQRRLERIRRARDGL